MESSPELDWESVLNIAKPTCCNLKAACCAVATPSVAGADLVAFAAKGDETARDFLSVFDAHLSLQEAQAFYPEEPRHIERILEMVAMGSIKGGLQPSEVVFYHCRYLGPDRRCQVYEDRPQFCRSYPASPMALLVKGCGYEAWRADCVTKLRELGYEPTL